jgi:simple sugar transport system permease protein
MMRAIIKDKRITILFVVFGVVLFGMEVLLGSGFFNIRNIVSMAFQMSEFGFLALAMALAMLTGGIDLSIIGNMNLAGILAALVLTNENLLAFAGETSTVLLALLTSLFVGLLCGILNGVLVSFIRVSPVVATIGTMMFYTGIGMAITGGRGIVGFPDLFMVFGNSRLLGVPLSLILMLLAFAVIAFALRRTVWGRSVYLLGSNYTAALFSGIRTHRTVITTYAIGGLMCGVAAIILSSRVNSARVGYGDTYLLQAILVSVMGSINPDGGSGNILGVLISILIIQSLSSAFTLFAITPYARGLIYGLVLITIMILNNLYGGSPSVDKTKVLRQS